MKRRKKRTRPVRAAALDKPKASEKGRAPGLVGIPKGCARLAMRHIKNMQRVADAAMKTSSRTIPDLIKTAACSYRRGESGCPCLFILYISADGIPGLLMANLTDKPLRLNGSKLGFDQGGVLIQTKMDTGVDDPHAAPGTVVDERLLQLVGRPCVMASSADDDFSCFAFSLPEELFPAALVREGTIAADVSFVANGRKYNETACYCSGSR